MRLPFDPEPLRRAAADCNKYDWIIFTSANAVAAFAARDCKTPVATVGAATREAAERHGFAVALTPKEYVAESLLAAFSAEDLNGRRILIPSAAITRDIIPAELRKRGAHVDVVEAYRNVIPPEAAVRAAAVFREPYPDWVTFASASAVHNLIQLAGTSPLLQVKIASIGPITSETIRKYDLTVTAEAEVHTAQGLVHALCQAAWASAH